MSDMLYQTPVVDSGTELARSLPTSVPESPRTGQPRTPRTPRTPGRQDPNKTPRFYPVMKESSSIDGQVRRTEWKTQEAVCLFRHLTEVE